MTLGIIAISLLMFDAASSLRDSCNLHSIIHELPWVRQSIWRWGITTIEVVFSMFQIQQCLEAELVMEKYWFVSWGSSGWIIATFTPQKLPQSLASGQFWFHLKGSHEKWKVYGFNTQTLKVLKFHSRWHQRFEPGFYNIQISVFYH